MLDILIAGIGLGIVLRLEGGTVGYWLSVRAMEREGFLFLGVISSIKRRLVSAGGALIAAGFWYFADKEEQRIELQ